jgi:hypothetical protein
MNFLSFFNLCPTQCYPVLKIWETRGEALSRYNDSHLHSSLFYIILLVFFFSSVTCTVLSRAQDIGY